jgi:UDP-N-acetylglucosamine 2-epimerase (non-hydrolysing)
MHKIHLIAAARPNFMKIAPLYHALKQQDWADTVIVHTGQHYDVNMSDVFFRDLRLPEPDIHLNVGSGSHAEQTANVMMKYEQVILREKPDLIIVVGDVNSTLGCTLAAAKINYRLSPNGLANTENAATRPLIAHLEAGLRSFDRTMPEEINRIVTDSLSDILWTPSSDGDHNLANEGVLPDKIKRVGNIMIDCLEMLRKEIEDDDGTDQNNLTPGNFGVVTLHRPSNVDTYDSLKAICASLASLAEKIQLVFPMHPRTEQNLKINGLYDSLAALVKITPPLNYIKFMNLVFNSRFVLTDSGGIQEETTYMGIPCVTVRDNTERPVTVTEGTNQLCKVHELEAVVGNIIKRKSNTFPRIDLWDGNTSERVVASIAEILR